MCALEVLKKGQVGGFHFYFAPMEEIVRALPPAYACTVANLTSTVGKVVACSQKGSPAMAWNASYDALSCSKVLDYLVR